MIFLYDAIYDFLFLSILHCTSAVVGYELDTLRLLRTKIEYLRR